MSAKKAPQYIAGLAAAFGAFCLGSALGWSSPASLKYGQYKIPFSSNAFGWVSSLLMLGAAVVCIPIGFIISLIGRKITMLVLVLPFVIGWLCMIWPPKVFLLYIGRFVIGMAGGAFCITAPMYTTEISQIEVRGILGCFFQLMIVHGILFSYIVGAFVDLKYLNIACTILPIIFFVIFIWMPESPVFLAQKGKTERLQKSMKWLRGEEYDSAAEVSQMQPPAKSNEGGPSLKSRLCRKTTLKGLFISIFLMLFQQMTGINAIVFYSTQIFLLASDAMKPEYTTIIVGVVMVIATIVSIFLIDKVGRRILLLVSAVVMAITTALMGIYFIVIKNNLKMVTSLSWLPILSICIFVVGFSIGFGPVPWLLIAELFAEDVKDIAGSISGTTNWVFAFIITKLFPIMISDIGAAATFFIFTVFAVLAIIFIIFFVPETKGKTLEAIQGELGG